MPAVKVFAINAGLAIVFNFILQVTAFLAIVKLDMDRQASVCFRNILQHIKSRKELRERYIFHEWKCTSGRQPVGSYLLQEG